MNGPLTDANTEMVQANGLSFACQSYGSETAPAMVLIRGLGTQLIEWSPVLIAELVAGGLRVVVFDNRDVGLSSKLSADYTLADMADDVTALMAQRGVGCFHVFGISLGGMVAQLVAVRHPQAVDCLISVMSSSGAPDLPRATRAVRERLSVSAQSRQGQIDLDVENRLIWGSPGYPEAESVRRSMATRIYDRCHYPEGVARQMLALVEDGSRVARLGELSCRTLVIHGAADPLLLPACGVATAAAINAAELQLIDGMGHNIPDALAPDVARRVLAFLAAG